MKKKNSVASICLSVAAVLALVVGVLMAARVLYRVAIVHETHTMSAVVAYSGWSPGSTLTVKGILLDEETSEALIDAAGNEITAEKSKNPSTVVESTLNLVFDFDDSNLEGKRAYIKETVYLDGELFQTLDDDNIHNIELGNWAAQQQQNQKEIAQESAFAAILLCAAAGFGIAARRTKGRRLEQDD